MNRIHLIIFIGLLLLGTFVKAWKTFSIAPKLQRYNKLVQLFAEKPASSGHDVPGSRKYQCKGCSYVFDESTGFKKRFPPGKLQE
jgi:hypothetical protein